MGALVLDLLLAIIFLMMIPIGFYRGGLRELSVSAGLLLGILMAQEWGTTWASLFERLFDMGEGTATFLMSALIAFGVTGLIGYGGSAAFSYRPGPGGRLYGAYLALFNAMIVAGFLINLYTDTILPESDVDSVTSGIVARSLSDGFGSVLLVATIGVGIATIFGMFVRERPAESHTYQPPAQSLYRSAESTRPYRADEANQSADAGEPIRIREITNWEDDAETARPDPSMYGTGWRQTWPESTPAQQRNTRHSGRRPNPSPSPNSSTANDPGASKHVLAEWIKDQDEN